MKRLLSFIIIWIFVLLLVCCSEDQQSQIRWFYYTVDDGLPSDVVYDLDEVEPFDLWIGTGEGISHYQNGGFTNYTTNDGLISDEVYTVLCHTGGDIYIGTDSGLSVFNGTSFTNFTTLDGLPSNNIISLSEDSEGDVWIATNGGGIAEYKNDEFNIYNKSNSELPSNIVWSVKADSGLIYIGTSEGGAIFTPPSDWQIFTIEDGLVNNTVYTIDVYVDEIWFGTANGASRYTDGEFTNYTTNNSELSNDVINDLAIEDVGLVWFATDGGGICKFQSGDWNVYNGGDGPLTDFITSVMLSTDDNKWFGTNGGGVVRLLEY